jgi:alkanesulfonate monooxygenase SsuD/methylene tetrahydromethanopterin reductase-like flavin-dependent oxidoreductase (luciferase family)
MTDRGLGAVEFGISLPNRAVLFGMPPNLLLETAERAEASGHFGSVWVGDNLTSKPRLEAVVTLSALAARTRRMKLGTICLASFPLRHPLLFALQWASLDVMSGGRTVLAVCSGGSASMGPQYVAELAAMGVDTSERIGRVEEGIALLRAFWSGPVTHHGRFYHFDEVEVLPRPARRIPIVLAVNPVSPDPKVTERAMRRVARLADGWQTDGTPPHVFAERWRQIRAYAAEYGRAADVTHASLHLMVNISDDAAAARRESVAFLDRYYGVGTISEEKLASWLAFGPPEAVIDKVSQFIVAGCTTVVMRFTSPDQQGQLERCLADVMPALRAAATSSSPR